MTSLGNFVRKLLAVLALVVALLVVYLAWARPSQLFWGATTAEIDQEMPGDELDPDPSFLSTRAITIQGTPEEIWPWLIQMGYGRAGFYGYDILENLGSASGIRSADRIVPEWQSFRAGDEVPISAVTRMKFHAVAPNEYMVWTGLDDEGAFTWALYPLDANHTRLVVRIRWSHHWSDADTLALDLFTEFADFLAVREILAGVKGRVEGQTESMMRQNAEFFVYVSAFVLFAAAFILLLLRSLTRARWVVALAAGVVWMVTWYSDLPHWLSVVLLQLPLLLAMLIVFRPRHSPDI